MQTAVIEVLRMAMFKDAIKIRVKFGMSYLGNAHVGSRKDPSFGWVKKAWTFGITPIISQKFPIAKYTACLSWSATYLDPTDLVRLSAPGFLHRDWIHKKEIPMLHPPYAKGSVYLLVKASTSFQHDWRWWSKLDRSPDVISVWNNLFFLLSLFK